MSGSHFEWRGKYILVAAIKQTPQGVGYHKTDKPGKVIRQLRNPAIKRRSPDHLFLFILGVR